MKGGIAVHARGGDRNHYRPVRSILHDRSDPVGLARAYRDRLGLDAVYVADLDAIAGGEPDLRLVHALSQLGVSVWIDAGLREARSAAPLVDSGASVVVAGLETLREPGALDEMVAQFGADRVAFSLDLRNGQPLVATTWGDDPLRIASLVAEQGAGAMIVLDLARVGAGAGVGTLGLIASIRRARPTLDLVAGGGVSGPEDLRRLAEAGASGVLVASALHDGRIIGP